MTATAEDTEFTAEMRATLIDQPSRRQFERAHVQALVAFAGWPVSISQFLTRPHSEQGKVRGCPHGRRAVASEGKQGAQ